MKLYDWNLYALGLTLGSLVLTRLYPKLPFSWQGLIVFIGLLLYALAYPALGKAAIQAIRIAMHGNAVWWRILLPLGVTVVQAALTLASFALLMSGWFNDSAKNS